MTKPEKTRTRRAQRADATPQRGRPVRRARKPKADGAETPATPAPSADPDPPSVRPGGKLGLVADLLRRPQGARIDEMMGATGWQAHTVRGCMSGALKARLKLAVVSEPGEAGRVYRLADRVSQ